MFGEFLEAEKEAGRMAKGVKMAGRDAFGATLTEAPKKQAKLADRPADRPIEFPSLRSVRSFSRVARGRASEFLSRDDRWAVESLTFKRGRKEGD
jgi:hypothetical protein